MRRLIETELEDAAARRQILADPEFIEAFREMWSRGKSGFSVGHLRRLLRIENEFLTRDLNDMVIYRSTVDGWAGQSMAQLYQRYRVGWPIVSWLTMLKRRARSRPWALRFGTTVSSSLALLQHFDRDLYWQYVLRIKTLG